MLTVVCASNRSGVTNWFRSIVGRHKDGGGSEPVPVPRTDRLPKLQLRLHHAANRTGPLQLPDAGWGHLCESLINFSVQLHKPVWVLVWREMRFFFFSPVLFSLCISVLWTLLLKSSLTLSSLSHYYVNITISSLSLLCSLSHFCFSAMCSFCLAHPNKVYCACFKKRLEEKGLCPCFNSTQSQTDSQHGPLPHPKRWLHPGARYVQPRRLPPSPLLLKESTQMEKMAGT